jgi:hypothetical protein
LRPDWILAQSEKLQDSAVAEPTSEGVSMSSLFVEMFDSTDAELEVLPEMSVDVLYKSISDIDDRTHRPAGEDIKELFYRDFAASVLGEDVILPKASPLTKDSTVSLRKQKLRKLIVESIAAKAALVGYKGPTAVKSSLDNLITLVDGFIKQDDLFKNVVGVSPALWPTTFEPKTSNRRELLRQLIENSGVRVTNKELENLITAIQTFVDHSIKAA